MPLPLAGVAVAAAGGGFFLGGGLSATSRLIKWSLLAGAAYLIYQETKK